MMQCNNASGVFFTWLCPRTLKACLHTLVLPYCPFSMKNPNSRTNFIQAESFTFKPNKSTLSHCLFWILKIMSWVCVRRLKQWGEWQVEEKNRNICSIMSWLWPRQMFGLLGEGGYSTPPHLIAQGRERESLRVPPWQANLELVRFHEHFACEITLSETLLLSILLLLLFLYLSHGCSQ